MAKEFFIIVHSDRQIRLLLQRLLTDSQRELTLCENWLEVQAALKDRSPDLVILGEKIGGESGLDLAENLTLFYPFASILLLVEKDSPELLKQAMKLGIADYITLPVRSLDLSRAIETCNVRRANRLKWLLAETKKTSSLHQRVEELETLTKLGRSVTSTLNPDEVFTAVVSAAVKLTKAEEGSLLLLDEDTGELYMRAAHNFHEDFARTFRLPIKDSVISSVLSTRKPILINENTPQKIKTAYLIHSLIYVPLILRGRAIGVLGVDNRSENKPLNDRDVKLLEALAEFAVIALENAWLFFSNIQEKTKLKTVLAGIQDGVLVIDGEGKVILMNEISRSVLDITDDGVIGKNILPLIKQKEMRDLITQENGFTDRVELTGMDGSMFDVRLVPIPDVGRCISFHDITHLKKMDRMKSDFVNTVSHDIRSPLTAIIGYTELLQRVGPLNSNQLDFIVKVLNNAKNITHLVDELLNLGRIEAGFDTRRERVSFKNILLAEIDNLKPKFKEKQILLKVNITPEIPDILANRIQIRQMVNNLIENACKYTHPNGLVTIRAAVEQDQVIFQVADTGIGIPESDLAYIFDKFFRGGNIVGEEEGTGLGLSIVKSIIEGHNGRIWVDSAEGSGSAFTVVLPIEP